MTVEDDIRSHERWFSSKIIRWRMTSEAMRGGSAAKLYSHIHDI